MVHLIIYVCTEEKASGLKFPQLYQHPLFAALYLLPMLEILLIKAPSTLTTAQAQIPSPQYKGYFWPHLMDCGCFELRTGGREEGYVCMHKAQVLACTVSPCEVAACHAPAEGPELVGIFVTFTDGCFLKI